jgi:DNA-binding NarL/FixJ family response regulator
VSTTEEVSEVAIPELSAVEQQVVLLVAQGRSRRAIADELGLSLKTVDWHVERGRRKLERAAALHDRMEREEAPTEITEQRRKR